MGTLHRLVTGGRGRADGATQSLAPVLSLRR